MTDEAEVKALKEELTRLQDRMRGQQAGAQSADNDRVREIKQRLGELGHPVE